MALAISDE